MKSPDGAERWIGAPPSSLEIGAVLLVGTAGILGPIMDPLLLGALQEEGRLSLSELGLASTAEWFALAIAASAAAFFRPTRLRWWGIAASLGLAAANVSVVQQSGADVIVNRLAAGFSAGVMYWLPMCLIARSHLADRWYAISLTLTTATGFLLASLTSAVILPRTGASGGFLVFAAIALLAAAVSCAMPRAFPNLAADPAQTTVRPGSATAILALVCVALASAGYQTVWTYLGPLASQAGHSLQVAGAAVSASLAAQVLSGIAAAALAGRFSYPPILAACSLWNLATLAIYAWHPSSVVFIATTATAGGAMQFLIPLQVLLVIDADPTRRAAVLFSGILMLGACAGPLLGSLAVRAAQLGGALTVAAMCWVLSIALMFWLQRFKLRSGLSAQRSHR